LAITEAASKEDRDMVIALKIRQFLCPKYERLD
jgi:hypothetical protein